MTTTFQANLTDTEYNGWTNYETWNVALWIQNDEGLYNLARGAGDYKTFADVMTEFYGDDAQTPDGVKYADPKVNVLEINSDVFDF
jgi:hypothetical protein